MAKNLKDKVVAITGGATGIGYEIATKYLAKGAKVTILLDLNENEGAKAVKSLNTQYGANKAVFYKCDVTKDLDDVTKKIFSIYKVDVLVNNAGIYNEPLIRKTIEINVTAVIEWAYKFREHMRTDKGGNGGTIINLASIYGYRVDQYVPVYQASKFAVMGFTKSMGHVYNYQKTGIRVVAICPGYTETKLVANPDSNPLDEQAKTDFSKFLKAQLWQKVDAVGNAAVDVFEKADSGTAWLIEGAKPIVQV